MFHSRDEPQIIWLSLESVLFLPLPASSAGVLMGWGRGCPSTREAGSAFSSGATAGHGHPQPLSAVSTLDKNLEIIMSDFRNLEKLF